MGCANEFLGLKIMLAGGPPYVVEREAVGGEIGEAAVGLFVGAVEENGHD